MNAVVQAILDALACGHSGCQCAATARRGSGNTHCPCHADDKPSLSVNTGKDGTVLVHCQTGGCSQDAVVAALRERGLWPEAKASPNGKPVAVYQYFDEGGALLFEAVKFHPKRFSQRRPDGNGGYVYKLDGVRRVLYHLPQLVAAMPDETVYIVEGEKDADRLRGLGFVATTSPMGAGKWRSEYADTLAGRNVRILPDNDGPGHSHAQDVAASLVGVAADVHILELPDLPEHGDVSDWLDNGGSAEELLSLADAAPIWQSEPVPDGAALLDDIAAITRRYVVLSPDQASATALWVIHSYAIDAADATPYLHITSPEKRSGKTRLLEVLDLLAARPWFTGRVTAAVLQRRLERDHPSLLLDETDAAFKKESEYSEALRAILNAGHRRGCKAWLCVKKGGDIDLVGFDVFGPKALAGIGKLPETVADRCIRLVLRRRAPNETVTRFRRREVEEAAGSLRERAERWATANIEALREARPDIPDYIDDRAIDGWEPLFAIADTAGGDWPQRSRKVALALSCVDVRDDDSVGVKLLSDIQVVFDDKITDKLPTAELLTALNAIEESPWGEWHGKPLTPRGLARLLRPFAIKSVNVRAGEDVLKGYHRETFGDAWERYLPCSPQSATSATSATQADAVLNMEPDNVADVADVAANAGMHTEATEPPLGRCPACSSTSWWYRADGTGPVCGVCHPEPAKLAMVFAMGAGI